MGSTTKQSKRAIGWTLSPENKAKIPEWNKWWEKHILSTDPINFEKTKVAVAGMYEAVGFPMPPRVVQVRSAMEGAIVCAWAAAFWHIQKRIKIAGETERATADATREATARATYDATYDATFGATLEATARATYDATFGATLEATARATAEATARATREATLEATARATARATADATRGTREGNGDANYMYAAARAVVFAKLPKQLHTPAEAVAKNLLINWYLFYNGGSEWSAWVCYLSFVRDVVGFKCPEHNKYKHYENALIHGGPRFVHRNFVLLCGRAKKRHTEIIDGTHRLHCETGPAICWGCGTEQWAVHGVIVDEQIVMRPETQDIKQIEAEKNEEVRRVRIERFGWVRYLKESGAEVIDRRRNEIDQQHECLLRDPHGVQRLVVADPSTARVYALGVPRDVKTCEQAQAWLNHGLQITHRS